MGDWLWEEITILFFIFIRFWIIIKNQVTLKCSCLVFISINILLSICCELGTKLLKMNFPFFSDKSNICLFKGNRKLKKSTKNKSHNYIVQTAPFVLFWCFVPLPPFSPHLPLFHLLLLILFLFLLFYHWCNCSNLGKMFLFTANVRKVALCVKRW